MSQFEVVFFLQRFSDSVQISGAIEESVEQWGNTSTRPVREPLAVDVFTPQLTVSTALQHVHQGSYW